MGGPEEVAEVPIEELPFCVLLKEVMVIAVYELA